MRSLTVVVTGDDESDVAVRRLAADWTAAGLLHDSVWVTAKDAAGLEPGPPHISARLVTGEGEGELRDLFEIIAVRRLTLVRVVLMQLLPYREERDSALLTIGRRVADLVAGVLPRDVTAAGGGTALRRVNLMVPETRTAGVGQELIASGWEVNAVVSPEDRPDVQQASILVRDGVNLRGHACAAVAGAGGLWRGVDEGAFDDVEPDSSAQERDLVVFRPWARLLLGDVLTQRIADEAMALVQDPCGSGATPYVSWAAVTEAPDEVVRQAHEELMARGEWVRDGLAEVASPPKSQLGVRAALGDVAAFQWRLLRAARRVVTNTATRWMEDRVTQLTAGEHGAFVVRVHPEVPDDALASAKQRLEAQAAGLRSDMLQREAAKMQPPAPETWDELRRLCFGLLDASPLPSGFSTPERASVREILPPRWVAPLPVPYVSDRAELEGEAPEGAPPSAPDEGRATSERAGRHRADSRGVDVDSRADGGSAGEDVPFSLLSRVDDTVAAREDEAQERAAKALECATDESPPDVSYVRKARRLLLACWIAVVLLSVGACIWGYVRYRITGTLALDGLLQGAATVLVIDLAVALFGGWRYYRALSRFERAVQTRLAERRHAAEVYVAAAREVRRLRLLMQGVRDWTDVIGWIVHRPWAHGATTADGASVDPGTLPASVAVAVPAPESNVVPRSLSRAAVAILCRRGWVRQLFDEMVSRLPEEDAAAGEGRGHLAADLDSGLTSDGARTRLLHAVASEELRGALAHAACGRMGAAVSEGTLRLPPRQVIRLGRYACPDPVSDVEFFARASEPPTPFVEELWTAEGMSGQRHLVADPAVWLPLSRRAEADGLRVRTSRGDASMRVDMSGTCQPSDLALFAVNERGVEAKVHRIGAGWV